MLEVPLAEGVPDSEAWSQLSTDDDLRPARQPLVDFLSVASLDPEPLSALDEEAAHARVAQAAPAFWQEELQEAWAGGTRYFYAIAFAAGFRSVGRPAIAVQWLRGETEDGGPTLMVGGTLAWSVLDTATRAVGVIAYRYVIVADLAEEGALGQAQLPVTIHGGDGRDGGGAVMTV